MEDMSNKEMKDLVKLLEEKGAQDITLLNVTNNTSWADYLLIATVNSQVQARGLEKYLKEFMNETDRELRKEASKNNDENWFLYDAGDVVINLMTREAREFYQLEELWFEAEQI